MPKSRKSLILLIFGELLSFSICYVSLILPDDLVAVCGNKGIEGTWVLVEEYESDGTKISTSELKDIGVSEKYVVNGESAEYTCEIQELEKPITMTFIVEQTGDNTYNFKISDDYVFVSPEVHGNKMSYTVGEGDDSLKMVFKSQ